MKKDITILFDLDGTLIDSTDAILESFYFAFNEQNYHFAKDDEAIKKHIGYPLEIMFNNLGIEISKTTKFVESYKNHYRNIYKHKTVLLNEAYEAVQLASKFANLGVVTTKTTKFSTPLMENFNLLECFDTFIGRQEVKNPKPNPEPIFKALENLQIEPSKNVYMIGDTKLDLIAANSANISSIGVLCGYGYKEELLKYTPLIATNSLEAVKKVVTLTSKA